MAPSRHPLRAVVTALVAGLLAAGCASTPAAGPGPGSESAAGGSATPAIPEEGQGNGGNAGATGGSRLGGPGSARAPAEAPPPPRPTGPFAEGVAAAKAGNAAEAAVQFEAAVAKDPSAKWAWYDLGVARERQARWREARSAYEKALSVDGNFSAAAGNLARLEVRQGQATTAEADLRARIDKHPANLDLRNDLAQVLVSEGRLDAAFTEAKKVLKADERNVGAMLILGQIFYHQKKYELAGSVLDNAAKLAPRDPAIPNLRAFVYLAQNDRKEALASFREAAGLRPDFPEAHVNYGAFLNEAQDFSQSVRELELAVRYAPGMVAAHLNLANAYRGAKAYGKALAEYQKVQSLDPGNKDVLFDLGLLYLDAPIEPGQTLDRLHKALAFFQQYQSAGGDDPRLSDYLKDAKNAIGKEQRKEKRAQQEALKKAKEAAAKEAAAEAKRKAEAAKKKAEEEAAAKKAAAEAAARAAESHSSRLGGGPPPPPSGGGSRLGGGTGSGGDNGGSRLGGGTGGDSGSGGSGPGGSRLGGGN